MYRIRQDALPFVGLSHNFVGADHGDVQISAYLLRAQPGQGPGPHRHPDDEVQFVREGRGRYTINGEEFEAGSGDIFWAGASVRGAAILLWAVVGGAGLLAAVGYVLTGATAPGIALLLAILALVSLGPGRFERGA